MASRTDRRRRASAFRLVAIVSAVGLAVGASACSRPRPPGGGGAGGAVYEADPGLARHTVYHPGDLGSVSRPMPVMVWGEGGCAANGTMQSAYLLAVAAKQVLVIASGAPGGSGQTTADMLVQGIDWAVAENSRAGSKYRGKIDTSKVTAQGFSCGGLEAVGVAARDRRVGSTVLWSSGIFPTGNLGGVTKAALGRLTTPTAWLNGGPSDIAYQNAVDDYAKVPSSVPSVLASYGNVGHGGMFSRSAEMAAVTRSWIDASLYGDAAARAMFVGPSCGLCSGTQWKMQSKNW